MDKVGETVLVVGGSGFLGQHIIKLLIQEQEKLGIKEIRTVDLKPYENRIGHRESKDLISFVGDICKPETIEKAFIGVDCVFHCAAYISIQFPPNFDELERVNVIGTKNIIEICLKHNVPRLIYTSSASVAFTPYKGVNTFAIAINQTESKAVTPEIDLQKSTRENDKKFLIPGYAASKLRAERVVLNSSGAKLNNGKDYLQTVALRPPLTYGEGDPHFMPACFEYLSKHNMQFPRISGAGGKQQLIYAGNSAWGHICAYKTLKSQPKKIAGLPIFITDDTPVHDVSRFIQRVGRETESLRFHQSWWSTPHFLFYFLAFLFEMVVKLLQPILGTTLKYSPRALSSYTASVMMFNRLRADIHLDYEPLVDEKKALMLSAGWYEKWWQENITSKRGKRCKQ
ncbi:unnamed protein product [Hermetia illucens]|uniref:3-beta hydroxysteroid dehydrogenase/isomerase domain-containing protein n=1 Tax=Hermetia illucens TaxID=343691 RepID=A0A7R8UMU1_HERIL|nr:3 beta-hydroxysteroid dehydrogenase/Delta 5-->4-isomerase [Hermetia illucens]CAD7083509.1 unnamed protein product [Hermetia illucens]